MQPGIYDGISADDYRAGDGVSVSTLKMMPEEGGPARVRYGKREETRAQFIGTLIHDVVLEPEKLDRTYHVVDLPVLNANHKAYQAAEIEAAGREIVRRVDYDNAHRIRDAILKQSSAARDLLAPGPNLKIEQSIYWIDEETGLLCRGRTDVMRTDYKVLCDLKSCVDATWDGFSKAIGEYKYHWQNAFYDDGVEAAGRWKPEAFIFIAVEKVEPFLTATYEIIPEDVQIGRDETRASLRHYAKCAETDTWPGLPDELQSITLPPWKRKGSAR